MLRLVTEYHSTEITENLFCGLPQTMKQAAITAVGVASRREASRLHPSHQSGGYADPCVLRVLNPVSFAAGLVWLDTLAVLRSDPLGVSRCQNRGRISGRLS